MDRVAITTKNHRTWLKINAPNQSINVNLHVNDIFAIDSVTDNFMFTIYFTVQFCFFALKKKGTPRLPPKIIREIQ